MSAYGLDPRQFFSFVIRPTLQRLAFGDAEALTLGTALQESELRYLKQRPSGPALGLFQTEPASHHDLYSNFLNFPARADLKRAVTRFASLFSSEHPDAGELVLNSAYACAVCRAIYYRAPAPLPDAKDERGLSTYWKAHYNRGGKGTIEQAMPHFRFAIDLIGGMTT